MSYEQALHRLASFCSKGERCKYDIQQKMIRWEISVDDQQKILSYLCKEKYIDELRFSKAFVNDKSKYNHWGINKIKYELKKKSIPSYIIKEALTCINEKYTYEILQQLLSNKKRSVKGDNEYEKKQKLIRFALNKGYSFDEIEKVINTIL